MHAPPETVRRARRLRREMTAPEARLWASLRRKAAGGFRFRRQHPLGPYVLDFYCDSARLAVEVDGLIHATEDRPQRDARRDAWLASQGVRTLRITAGEVRDELEGVVGLIVATARGR
ncbi:MAG: endonuclease domain-containing protein [Caulobacteraceae bacterium]